MTQNTPKFIRKRDGRKEVFYPEKITHAVDAALIEEGLHDLGLAKAVTDDVVAALQADFKRKIPTVEQVQDITERVLMDKEQYEVAKAYILYRQERSRLRDSKSRLMQTFRGIAFSDARDNDIKRENANVDGNTAMGTMLKFGSESTKEFAKTAMMRPEHARAHDEGDIHIHDLDFLPMGTLTCCQIDILDLLERGFSTGHGFIRQPQSISSYAALAAIILQADQNEQHGGQSIPNFDYALAVGVRKSFVKYLAANLVKMADYKYDKKLDTKKVRSLLSTLKPEVRYPQLGKEATAALASAVNKKFSLKITSKDVTRAVTEAAADTKRETYQALEGLIHNLNTMHSRAGAQVPFTSINFGTDTTPEGRLVSEALLEATWNGLGHGETPIFPISIFKVKEGINYNPEDPNYDLFVRSMEVSARRLFPNFTFIDAPFNLQYYKPGDYRTEIATMGCRTRVFGSVFPESDGRITSRGNLSFTTINLPALGIKHGIVGERQGESADWDGFYQELDEKMALVTNQLLERFEVQAGKKVKNFPFLMGQGVWMNTEGLGPEDTLRDAIKHGTLSMGFFGLAECLVAMMGEHHGQSAKAQAKGLEIIRHMRQYCDDASKRYTLNFTLLATPAEGISGRFVKLDKKRFGVIKGVTDRDYYTNSFHVPVYFPISAFDKIDIEAPYHALSNAGHITYIELDGDPLKNIDAFKSVVRRMKEAGIGYGSVNHPVDRDPVCGFSGIIEGDVCPSCGRHDGEDGVRFERLRRITGYLVGTLDRWNDGKRAEEHDRVKHGVRTGAKR